MSGSTTARFRFRPVLVGLAAGLVFVAGLVAVRSTLTEWKDPGRVPGDAEIEERFEELAGSLGLVPGSSPRRRVWLHGGGREWRGLRALAAGAGEPGAAAEEIASPSGWFVDFGEAFLETEAGRPVLLHAGWDRRGDLVQVSLVELSRALVSFQPLDEGRLMEVDPALFLRPGERYASSPPMPTERPGRDGGWTRGLVDAEGWPLPFTVEASWDADPPSLQVERSPWAEGAFKGLPGCCAGISWWWLLPTLLVGLGAVVWALVLIVGQKLGIEDGLVLAVFGAGVFLALLFHATTPGVVFLGLAAISLILAFLVFACWSVGQSLEVLAGRSEAFRGLGELRRGAWTRETAGEMASGLAAGVVLAGGTFLTLALLGSSVVGEATGAIVMPTSWILMVPAILGLPVWSWTLSGLIRAAIVLLILAVARRLWRWAPGWAPEWASRWAPERVRGWLVAGLGLVVAVLALVLPSLATSGIVFPWSVPVIAGTVALLGFVYERRGALALVVGSLTAIWLPSVAFATIHWPALDVQGIVHGGMLLVVVGTMAWAARGPARRERDDARPAWFREVEEQRRLEAETTVLAELQARLLPDRLPQPRGWQVAARSLAAREVGGDFYDFFVESAGGGQDDVGLDDAGSDDARPGDDGPGGEGSDVDGSGEVLWIAAGDVAGHGLACSVAHGVTKGALASLLGDGVPGRAGDLGPARVLSEVDRALRSGRRRGSFVALAVGRLEVATGELVLASAGYPYALVVRAAGGVEEVVLPALPLGVALRSVAGDGAGEARVRLEPGDGLVLHSDGLMEAPTAAGEPWGQGRVRGVLEEVRGVEAERMLEVLFGRFGEATGIDGGAGEGGAAPPDDVTAVVVGRRRL